MKQKFRPYRFMTPGERREFRKHVLTSVIIMTGWLTFIIFVMVWKSQNDVNDSKPNTQIKTNIK